MQMLAWLLAALVGLLLCADILNEVSLYLAVAALPKPPAFPLHLRDAAEFGSFCATILLPFIALGGGVAAYYQFKAAEKTRLVSAYMAVSEKWDSDGIADARRQLQQFEAFYEAHRPELDRFADAAAYIHQVIAEAGDRSTVYKNYLLLMSYLEDIGFMCENNYLHINDVNNIIGDGIKSIMRLLLTHITHDRSEMARQEPLAGAAHYANALRLYRRLDRMQPATTPGYGVAL